MVPEWDTPKRLSQDVPNIHGEIVGLVETFEELKLVFDGI